VAQLTLFTVSQLTRRRTDLSKILKVNYSPLKSLLSARKAEINANGGFKETMVFLNIGMRLI